MRAFGLLGASGFVAPRHMAAIRDTGNCLVAACDPHDSVGVLDGYFPDCKFFTEIERFDRHLEKLRRSGSGVEWLSVCTPNYLHDAHCRLGLRIGADVICEKPLVISPWNLNQLQELEAEYGRRINVVLQLRVHPRLVELKSSLSGGPREVELVYISPRGPWYLSSWKGSDEKSGGVVMNIGIHLFDLLLWLFGGVAESRVFLRDRRRAAGALDLEQARVAWFLSIDRKDIPSDRPADKAYRLLRIDGQEIEFSEMFNDLHTEIYRRALRGEGFGIDAVRPATELVHSIRLSELEEARNDRDRAG